MKSNRLKKKRVSFPQVLLKADSMIGEPTNYYMSHFRQRRMSFEANRDPISEFSHSADYVIFHTPAESHTVFQRIFFELAQLECKKKEKKKKRG